MHQTDLEPSLRSGTVLRVVDCGARPDGSARDSDEVSPTRGRNRPINGMTWVLVASDPRDATRPQSCYTDNMKSRTRRTGASETFSVSVDPETKRALRALANQDFQGNLSAAVTDLAADARRRMAAGAYLRRHGISVPTKPEADLLEADIAREVAAAKKRRRRRKVA